MKNWHLSVFLLALSLNFGCATGPSTISNRQPASDETSGLVGNLDRDFEEYTVPDEAVRSLRQYTAMYYEPINSGLRAEDIEVVSAMSNRICSVDSLIFRFPIKASQLILYRGHGYLPPGGDRIGFEFVERGFLSTSISEKVASRFLRDRKTPVLDIISFPTAPVPGLWVHPLSLVKDEYEVLLSRGLKFRVVEVEKRKSFFSPTILIRKLIFEGFAEKNSQLEKTLGCRSDQ